MSEGKFAYYTFRSLQRGDKIEVTLKGNAANLRLMTQSNFSNYKAGRKYSCSGGLAKRSPAILDVPSNGTWILVVDMAGLKGTVRSSARVLPRAMKPLRTSNLPSSPPITQSFTDRSNVIPTADTTPTRDHYDVFISHASEDKEEVARPLADSLQHLGLAIWYDELTLRIGDSLRESIANGINRSEFAILVLSEEYLQKGWTKHELNGVFTRHNQGHQKILPIWHKISKEKIVDFDPALADIYALNTANSTSEEIAQEVRSVILGTNEDELTDGQ